MPHHDNTSERLFATISWNAHTEYCFSIRLFISYISTKNPDYHLSWTISDLTKRSLADALHDINPMDNTHRLLSELVLERKITEKDDEHDLAVEVEQILWKHGRDLLKQKEIESRKSG